MIVNRNDRHMRAPDEGYGVGYQLLSNSCFDPVEVGLVLRMLSARHRHFGAGVVAIDGGANIGVHTLEWARHMHGWGSVVAFEAQEMVFYALAGNIALNNCLNARARLAALGQSCGELRIPQPDYLRHGSFGSLELRQTSRTEFIGQDVSYEDSKCVSVPLVNLDSLPWARIDFVKLDVEGMEADVLRGAQAALARHRPILLVEVVKSDINELRSMLSALGYQAFHAGMNLLAVHESDPSLKQISLSGDRLTVVSPAVP